jgi:hypothetical protein
MTMSAIQTGTREKPAHGSGRTEVLRCGVLATHGECSVATPFFLMGDARHIQQATSQRRGEKKAAAAEAAAAREGDQNYGYAKGR